MTLPSLSKRTLYKLATAMAMTPFPIRKARSPTMRNSSLLDFHRAEVNSLQSYT